ncbi:Permease of the drug/metabolite transporter (DMT) superfamily [hydrothermal vent metagenome]|uniref:Permease of the drug/metabolite transporter (DMT) superfamily n=1 Tax=hydrothermal vent metagenome TaxID=652676 RepID=A0A3B0U9U3_9ZZZZ
MIDPVANRSSSPVPARQLRWLGYLLGALGAAFFATKGIFIKLGLVENVDVLTMLTWRMIIAVPFFIAIGISGLGEHKSRLEARGGQFHVSRNAYIKAAFIGMIGYYLASYLDFAGLKFISAQFDRLILLTYPFFVLLFDAVLFRKRVSAPMIFSLLISYAGLAVIFAYDFSLEGARTVLGASLVVGAAVFYALYQVLAKPLIDQMGARLFTSIALSAAGLGVMMQFLFTHQLGDLVLSPRAMAIMVAMGTISTVVPAYLIAASIGRIGPGPTAVMGNISPLVTIALAISVLGENFSLFHAAGSALVLLGIFAFSHAERRSG